MVPSTTLSAGSPGCSRAIFSGRRLISAVLPSVGIGRSGGVAWVSLIPSATQMNAPGRFSRTVPVRKFDFPRKLATKRVRGAPYSSAGAPSCTSFPARRIATRSDSDSASS